MKNTLRIILGLTIIIAFFSFISCEQERVDNDVITGKWIKESILLTPDSLIDPCEKKSYLEFSEYFIDLNKRTVSFYDACNTITNDEGEEVLAPKTELLGYYTIIKDTLKVKYTATNQTIIYNIGNINSRVMKLTTLDKNGDPVTTYYNRFKD